MEAIEVGLKLLSTKHDSWVWLCWDYRGNQEDSVSSQAWEYAGKRSSWASLLASQHATVSDQRVSENMSNKPTPNSLRKHHDASDRVLLEYYMQAKVSHFLFRRKSERLRHCLFAIEKLHDFATTISPFLFRRSAEFTTTPTACAPHKVRGVRFSISHLR
jgi:hypothetical protein